VRLVGQDGKRVDSTALARWVPGEGTWEIVTTGKGENPDVLIEK
jgi:hypothetical protein